MDPLIEEIDRIMAETNVEGADIRKDSVRQARDIPCDALSILAELRSLKWPPETDRLMRRAADELERLVSRNSQLEAESLKRDTELRMERDTNIAHCKARVVLEAERDDAEKLAESLQNRWAQRDLTIDRLTAELQGVKDELYSVDKAAKELGAERDRLRAAIVDAREALAGGGEK